jgi:outer membrane protein assembly factor BamD (BamD/ComL family)
MSRRARTFLAGAMLAAAVALVSSCASGPVQIPPGLSVAEIFQRAQDAEDSGNYKLALRYYSLVATDYPTDVVHVTWASYEIAFLYHKMGNDKEAVALFNALLDQYATKGDQLPPAPRVLAAKIKARLEETLKTSS